MGKIKLPPDFEDLPTAAKMVFYRGTIIEAVSLAESNAEEIIALHFCGIDKNKRTEFLFFVLSKNYVNLSSKIKILKHIIFNYYKDENSKDILDLFKGLTIFRNRMAHDKYFPDSVDNVKKNGNPFLYNYGINRKNVRVYKTELTADYIADRVEEAVKISKYFNLIMDKMEAAIKASGK